MHSAFEKTLLACRTMVLGRWRGDPPSVSSQPGDASKVMSFGLHCTFRYVMGLIPSRKNLELCDNVTVSAFCR